MQTRPIDALLLWWREINFTTNQRKALAITAIVAVAVSAFYIFKPNQAQAISPKPVVIKPATLIVDVAGEVTNPGVYELNANARVIDALKAAGGAKPSADLSLINLARLLKDGEQIYIDKKINGSNSRTYSRSSARQSNLPTVLNINRATAKELESLPGIGPVLAARIVEFRSTNGSFLSIEDLKKVPGIGGSKLEKFKEKIRI
jgi:competence protein ComEA